MIKFVTSSSDVAGRFRTLEEMATHLEACIEEGNGHDPVTSSVRLQGAVGCGQEEDTRHQRAGSLPIAGYAASIVYGRRQTVQPNLYPAASFLYK